MHKSILKYMDRITHTWPIIVHPHRLTHRLTVHHRISLLQLGMRPDVQKTFICKHMFLLHKTLWVVLNSKMKKYFNFLN